MLNNSNTEYSIPNGGDFNLFCKFDKNLNLDLIKENFENHNIRVEYKMSEDDMWISLYDSSNEQIRVVSEKYSFNNEYQSEMIEDYIEDFGNNNEIIDLLKKVNSNYYFNAHNYRESVFVYILAYLLSEQTDVLLYDCFNGCYLNKNKLNSILDEKK